MPAVDTNARPDALGPKSVPAWLLDFILATSVSDGGKTLNCRSAGANAGGDEAFFEALAEQCAGATLCYLPEPFPANFLFCADPAGSRPELDATLTHVQSQTTTAEFRLLLNAGEGLLDQFNEEMPFLNAVDRLSDVVAARLEAPCLVEAAGPSSVDTARLVVLRVFR